MGNESKKAMPFVIEGGHEGYHYRFQADTNTLAILDGPLTIRNAEDRPVDTSIVICDSAQITLAGVNIDCSKGACAALRINDFCQTYNDVEIVLKMNTRNILRSGPGYAGLEKNGRNNGRLVISGSGSLEAYGTGGGAGIGGGNGANTFDIIIKGGIIKAESTFRHGVGGGAGIGGGAGGYASGLQINGGCISASSEGGAGIGDGLDITCLPNSIQGGVIYTAAYSKEYTPYWDQQGDTTVKLESIPSIRSRNFVFIDGGIVEAHFADSDTKVPVKGGIVRRVTLADKEVDPVLHFEEEEFDDYFPSTSKEDDDFD